MKYKNETIKINLEELKENINEKETFDNVLANVYKSFANIENQDPIRNIIEYFISGEPLYITRNNGARNLICRYDKDDLLNHIIKSYYEKILKIKT